MATLTHEQRKLLENTVVAARDAAERGAEKILTSLGAGNRDAPGKLSAKDTELRNQLRAHGRQLGDKRHPNGSQETTHLKQACAYEHWHRLLFARFLAENDLLVNPEYGVAMSLAEIQETARAKNLDWLSLASDYAQRMLLEVFRPHDPVLQAVMPPENRQEMEEKLARLPAAIFAAEDSLGWVYQFWQRDEKERINKSQVKIDADQLPSVTQLFTEDYMVLFLLHNSLGAWWAAKRRGEGKDHTLPGYEWTYLRLNNDGTPAAGSFDGWPQAARDLKVLDPSAGSGHFLVSALPILVGFRMEEESLSREQAVFAVLRDNLFGLELDNRCTQIATFNLALMAWRIIGSFRELPPLNIACSGLGINAKEEDWLKLAGRDSQFRQTMEQLYALFRQGPLLGSLIDPKRTGGTLFSADFERVRHLLVQALTSERGDDSTEELAIAARGIVDAAQILASTFTLVVTNVPYLGTRRQAPDLRDYLESAFADARHDLATSFLSRCLSFCADGGTIATVSPQNWANIGSYKQFRVRTLSTNTYNCLASLGTGAFETISGEVVNVWLNVITNSPPSIMHAIIGADVSASATPGEKARALLSTATISLLQKNQLANPDARIILEELESKHLLSSYADCLAGIQNGDSPCYLRLFWEIPDPGTRWHFIQTAVNKTANFGGMDSLIDYDMEEGHLRASAEWRREALHDSDQRGKQFWKRRGVLVSRMGKLPVALYLGDPYDQASTVIVPRDQNDLPAIWAYCSSDNYSLHVRKLDKKVNVTSGTLVKVPFDAAFWRSAAAVEFFRGLPLPHSTDPTQWLFEGQPTASNSPLHVAIARLLGYRWPRQCGMAFPDSPALEADALEAHADSDGIACLNTLAGNEPAAKRLRTLLESAYGAQWSAAKLTELLKSNSSLEEWLRDQFFEEHCRLFYGRPFVWHIWDGRKDGFHALVNYHKLAGPNGKGRKTLEKLIYTLLGDWISRQRAEVASGADGAEARLSAALHLYTELEKILQGDPPYDIFIRWKPIHEQAIGWEADLNDGVRLNMRPWLMAKPYQMTKKDSCILRVTPIKLPLDTDRGNEPPRDKTDFPWLAETQDRNNDIHLTRDRKQKARERKKA